MLIETDKGLLLSVKVTPRAKRTQIVGWENEVLKIKVSAVPEKGEANRAVIEILSKTLRIPQKNILLLRGATSRTKQFCLVGITKEQVEHFLQI